MLNHRSILYAYTYTHAHLCLLHRLINDIRPVILLLAVHDASQPGLDLRSISGPLAQQADIDIAIADGLHRRDEVLYH